MIFIWNFNSVLVGFLFGLGFGGGFIFIANEMIISMQKDEPDNEFINSNLFASFIKFLVPIGIIIGCTFLIGPLFAWGHDQFMLHKSILGLSSRLAFVIIILIFSLILDIAVFLTKTPYPLFKLFSNTWMFLTLGLLLNFLLN